MAESDIMKGETMDAIRKENLFFFIAVIAVLAAGDLIWWQAKQMNDELAGQTAIIAQPAARRDHSEQDALRMERELQGIDQQLDQDYEALQSDLSQTP